MKIIVRHFKAEIENERPFYGYVSFGQDARIDVFGSRAMPVDMLVPVLNAAIPNWKVIAEDAHVNRKTPWIVQTRYGSSGCKDVRVRYLVDREICDQAIGCSVHVSMYEKLNEGFRVPLQDLAVLMMEIIGPQLFNSKSPYVVEVWEPRLLEGYTMHGTSSGILNRTMYYERAIKFGVCEEGIREFCNMAEISADKTYVLEEIRDKITPEMITEKNWGKWFVKLGILSESEVEKYLQYESGDVA